MLKPAAKSVTATTPAIDPIMESRKAKVRESLAKANYHAASLAHIHRFSDGEAGALRVCRALAEDGEVESYSSRGALMWRPVPVRAPAA